MTTYSDRPAAMGTLRMIVFLALLAAVVAAVAGIWFWVADPAEGSALYDTLGPAAAFSGLASGALFIAAAIWAQAKGLWRYLPTWVRLTTIALLLVGLASSIINWSRQ